MHEHGAAYKQWKKKKCLKSALDLVAVKECIAHLVCSWTRFEPNHGHYIVVATIECAMVRKRFWTGKQLKPNFEETFLTFLGSGEFGHVHPHIIQNNS